ncbi:MULTISPECIES: glycosyltransferase family 4 protein [unclassified Polaribacter]|uniref:glycosyltransferase family 4 protein n=1 Tax=unclassified Polaribacter TaxID=196858 RepID=UPI0011BE4BCA|nr:MULTISPECIES: glycosyltransferase family 4 protein [unclassified Polaribacter]TXD54288.1 glycosyltransferase family 4 protein [Polaribacter sp. IC063]TXD62881.1 glycosyltransferase family 4 protein [Polaribacter sp. IC066]
MKQKLSVLFVCGWYPSRVLPNNGDFIQRHAEALNKEHKVTVIHIITDKNNKKNIEFISNKINGIETHIAYLKYSKNAFKKVLLFIKAFNGLIAKTNTFHIVHLNEIYPFGIFSLYLKWFKKTPFIITEHFTDYTYPLSKKISLFEKMVSKLIVKKASFVCPVTKDLENSLIQFGLKGNYAPVENVVNTKKFHPIETNNEVFSIIHISNMNDIHKNISGILKVIANLQHKISGFHLKIIGENSKDYQNFSEELGILSKNIEFIAHIPHHLIKKHLQEANLFILFSNFENLPCVILESFACGIPVISSDVGGIHEYFPDNFGTLINAKDEKKLEEEILNYFHKKHQIVSKQEMHRYIASNFSDQVICEKFTNLYYKTLSN